MFIFGMCLIEMKPAQFSIGKILYPAASLTDTVNRLIMNDDKLAILCHLHIQLNAVCVLFNCFLKRFQGIFRRITARAPVRPYFCSVHTSPPFSPKYKKDT